MRICFLICDMGVNSPHTHIGTIYTIHTNRNHLFREYPYPLIYIYAQVLCNLIWHTRWKRKSPTPWQPKIIYLHGEFVGLSRLQIVHVRSFPSLNPDLQVVSHQLQGVWQTVMYTQRWHHSQQEIWYWSWHFVGLASWNNIIIFNKFSIQFKSINKNWHNKNLNE